MKRNSLFLFPTFMELLRGRYGKDRISYASFDPDAGCRAFLTTGEVVQAVVGEFGDITLEEHAPCV